MKKLLLLSALLIFACSDDDGNPCIYEPTLTTQAATDITETSATLNGVISIVSENCDVPNNTEQGFVYSTEIQPTLEDIQVNVNGTNITTTIEGLEPNTTYYVRAFLTNNLGEFYGNEVSFTTVEDVCLVEEVEDLHIDVDCFGGDSGSFTIEISDCDTAPYYISVLDTSSGVMFLQEQVSNSTYSIDDLIAGEYAIFVEDANGNSYSTTVTILQPDAFQISIVVSEYNGYGISCFGENDGNIQINIQGGIAPFNVIWSNGTSAGEDLFNLSPGIYSVAVTDALGCYAEANFTITEPVELIVSNIVVLDLPAFAVSGGVPTYNYELFIDGTLYDSGTSADLIDNSYVYDPNFSGNGTYIFIVTDANGCVSEQLEIIEW